MGNTASTRQQQRGTRGGGGEHGGAGETTPQKESIVDGTSLPAIPQPLRRNASSVYLARQDSMKGGFLDDSGSGSPNGSFAGSPNHQSAASLARKFSLSKLKTIGASHASPPAPSILPPLSSMSPDRSVAAPNRREVGRKASFARHDDEPVESGVEASPTKSISVSVREESSVEIGGSESGSFSPLAFFRSLSFASFRGTPTITEEVPGPAGAASPGNVKPAEPSPPTEKPLDFRRWVEQLSAEVVPLEFQQQQQQQQQSDVSCGAALMQAAKRHICRPTAAAFGHSCSLNKYEACAIALYSSPSGISSLVGEELDCAVEATPGLQSSGSVAKLHAQLTSSSSSSRHAPFLLPLTSGWWKLPTMPTSTILFCTLELSVIQQHEDFQANFSLPTILSVCTKISPLMCEQLGGASHCRILCIKASTARSIGPLNMSSGTLKSQLQQEEHQQQSSLNHAEKSAGGEGEPGGASTSGEEALLLPGWRGRVVGTLQQRWKPILSNVLGWDVTAYTIMEIVEETPEPPDDEGTTTSSPSMRRKQKTGGLASSPSFRSSKRTNSTTATAARAPAIEPEPFLAKEYLVQHVSDVLRLRPDDCKWNMFLGLLHSYATLQYASAKTAFEAVLKVKTSDQGAQLQLALLLDRHLNDAVGARRWYEGALRSGTDNGNISYLLGSLLRRKLGEYGAAKRCFESALRLDPRHVAAHAEYGWILENYVGDSAGAEAHFDSAIRMEPNHAEANFCLGHSKEVHHKDYKAARRHYNLCVATDPNHAEGHFRLGRLMEEHYQQFAEARIHYEAAVRIQPQHADGHHLLGYLLLMHLHDVEQAEKHLRLAIETNPKHADAHNHLGYLIWRHNERKPKEQRWEEARSHFLTALSLDPRHANAHSNLARGLLEEEGNAKLAEEHFAEAVKLDPNNVYVRTSYAALLLDYKGEVRSEVQLALLHLEVAVAKNPCHAPSRLHLARALLRLHKPVRKAMVELELAVQLDGQYSEAYNELGQVEESRLSDFTRAREHYCKAVEVSRGTNVAARNNLGLLLWKHFSDVLQARQQFEEARTLQPENVDVLRNLSTLLLEEFRDYRRARLHLETVVRCTPKDTGSLTLLATILKKGFADYRGARGRLEEARRINPRDTTVLNELGLLYAKRFKDSVMALELFEEVLGIDPTNACAKTNVNRILTYSKRYQARKEARRRMASLAHPVDDTVPVAAACESKRGAEEKGDDDDGGASAVSELLLSGAGGGASSSDAIAKRLSHRRPNVASSPDVPGTTTSTRAPLCLPTTPPANGASVTSDDSDGCDSDVWSLSSVDSLTDEELD